MALVSPTNVSDQNLVASYVLVCRGRGLFLPYVDYQIIASWLQILDQPKLVILVLSEILPTYYRNSSAQGTLNGLYQVVANRLRHLQSITT